MIWEARLMSLNFFKGCSPAILFYCPTESNNCFPLVIFCTAHIIAIIYISFFMISHIPLRRKLFTRERLFSFSTFNILFHYLLVLFLQLRSQLLWQLLFLWKYSWCLNNAEVRGTKAQNSQKSTYNLWLLQMLSLSFHGGLISASPTDTKIHECPSPLDTRA